MPPSGKKKRKKDEDEVTDLEDFRNELEQYVERVAFLEKERDHLLSRNTALTEDKMALERQLVEAQAKNKADVAKLEVVFRGQRVHCIFLFSVEIPLLYPFRYGHSL